jgi:hypothetical protein
MLERMDISPENTARKHLAGEAMVIFADEKKRRQYDTTLRLEPLDILIKEIERLCLPEGKITPQRANVFYWKAREKGFPTADAEAALNKLIHDKKWPPIVPDDPIEQLNKATTTRHTQRSIFVSHSHQDAAFCQELVVALRAAGANVWYDEHNMGSGQLTPTIERELRARSIFVVILSPSAIQSQWVAEETLWAYNLYRGENTRTILPVLAAPVNERDIWLFLQNFKRIELPGGQPYPKAEAIGRVVAAMQAIA